MMDVCATLSTSRALNARNFLRDRIMYHPFSLSLSLSLSPCLSPFYASIHMHDGSGIGNYT